MNTQPFTIRLSGAITDVPYRLKGPPMVFRTLDGAGEGAYFNTTNETGQTLKTYQAKATEQERRILAIMQDLGMASPSQVHAAIGKTCPLTSVRRAMTNLTNAGRLVKMEQKVVGAFGRREHVWKIVTP